MEKEKNEVITQFIKEVGKMSIMVFTAFDLKTHIDAMVVDESTKEEYVITINKVSNGKLFKDGGIVFTKKQKEDFAVGFADWLRYESVCLPEHKDKSIEELLEIYKKSI